jgi:hypothetical protein
MMGIWSYQAALEIKSHFIHEQIKQQKSNSPSAERKQKNFFCYLLFSFWSTVTKKIETTLGST